MLAQLRRELFPQPVRAPAIALTADHLAEALILSAIATGELEQLRERGEAAVLGLATLRARWLAFAALLALHQQAEFEQLARPLGLGLSPLRQLASCRRAAWWNEDDVGRVFVALAEGWSPRVIRTGLDLRQALSGVLADLLKQNDGGVE